MKKLVLLALVTLCAALVVAQPIEELNDDRPDPMDAVGAYLDRHPEDRAPQPKPADDGRISAAEARANQARATASSAVYAANRARSAANQAQALANRASAGVRRIGKEVKDLRGNVTKLGNTVKADHEILVGKDGKGGLRADTEGLRFTVYGGVLEDGKKEDGLMVWSQGITRLLKGPNEKSDADDFYKVLYGDVEKGEKNVREIATEAKKAAEGKASNWVWLIAGAALLFGLINLALHILDNYKSATSATATTTTTPPTTPPTSGGGTAAATGTATAATGTATAGGTPAAPGSAPAITRVTPNKGPMAGGVVLTITGNNFDPAAEITVVEEATGGFVTVVGATIAANGKKITMTLPARGASGLYKIVIKNADGQTAEIPFTYDP